MEANKHWSTLEVAADPFDASARQQARNHSLEPPCITYINVHSHNFTLIAVY